MAESRRAASGGLGLGIGLEIFSILWMIVEAGIALAAGLRARSFSLEAFGFDSLLELISAAIVLWWLLLVASGRAPTHTHSAQEWAERITGVGLLLLAVYVTAAAIDQLVSQSRPQTSLAGLFLSAAAALVMPALYLLKRHTAARLSSSALHSDAVEALACGWMAWALLLGLLLHRLLGWWQADPAAALVLAALLVREGWEGTHEWFERGDEP